MTTESGTAEEELSAKMLVCSHCPKTFRYNSERTRHEMSHSPGFECEVCGKKFSFISALRRHCKQHERKGSVKCEECKRKFRDEVLLQRHIKYAHKGTFSCSKCCNTFSSEQALSTHMKTHRPESERRFKCSFDVCGKSFNFSHHLKHHELTHTNAKQHYCSVCGKGFIQYHHLKTHLKTHDPSKWLYCHFPGCKKKFSTEYAKKRHIATHKVKPDSGISSDSNSCDASVSSKDYAEDFILCASCGENVYLSDISKHSIKCRDITDLSENIDSCIINPIKEETIFEQSFFKASRTFEIPIKEEHKINTVKSTAQYDKDIPDCKSAIGGCIMGPNNCVCTQMSQAIDDNYDFTPIDNTNNVTIKNYDTVENNNKVAESNNNNVLLNSYSEVILGLFDNKENEILKNVIPVKTQITSTKPTNSNNICEGCDCASTCSVIDVEKNDGKNKIVVTSNVHTVDGMVKIKDTFDIDIPIANVDKAIVIDKVVSDVKIDNNVNKVDNEFVPYNTCRDVIGNCLVGGSDGCLCARMMMDNQQAMAQEIDDITPVPTT